MPLKEQDQKLTSKFIENFNIGENMQQKNGLII